MTSDAETSMAIEPGRSVDAVDLEGRRHIVLLESVSRRLDRNRVSGPGLMDDRPVFLKFFLGRAAGRRALREWQGAGALEAAGLSAAPRIGRFDLRGAGVLVVFERLPEHRRFDQALAEAADGKERRALLDALFAALGRLHRAGLEHKDLHFGNVVVDARGVHLVDASAVRSPLHRALAGRGRLEDLEALLSILPRRDRHLEEDLVAIYARSLVDRPSGMRPRPSARRIARRRQAAWRSWLEKTRRTSGRTLRGPGGLVLSRRLDAAAQAGLVASLAALRTAREPLPLALPDGRLLVSLPGGLECFAVALILADERPAAIQPAALFDRGSRSRVVVIEPAGCREVDPAGADGIEIAGLLDRFWQLGLDGVLLGPESLRRNAEGLVLRPGPALRRDPAAGSREPRTPGADMKQALTWGSATLAAELRRLGYEVP